MNPGAAPVLIRRLAAPDAAAYRALMLDGYARDPAAFTATVAERAGLPLAFWEARMEADDSASQVVLGALVDGQLAGAVGLAFEHRPKLRHKASLFGMYVAHHARRRGLGRLLVGAALDEARRREGIVQVQLTVTQGNPAPEGLYAQCGFVPYGIEPMAVQSGDGFAAKVHMWRCLRAGTCTAVRAPD